MAYVSFADYGTGELAEAPSPSTKMEGFSPVEWSVVALAERDPLSSLARPGRVAVALGGIFGHRRDRGLADARLEVLRRVAVLNWRGGGAVPPSEVEAFMNAGFSAHQYQTLEASIGAVRGRKHIRGTRM